MPALVTGYGPDWLPVEATDGRPVVLLVLDGLGRLQLDERLGLAPAMAAMGDGWLTSVAPTTTATALTSIATGVPPGEHGVMGYRIRLGGDVMNALRWQLDEAGDARRLQPADEVQPVAPFLGSAPVVITKREFQTTGFTTAHLRGGQWTPWSVASGIVDRAAAAVEGGARLVYAYYDGIDKVAHLDGLGRSFDLEVGAADHLVGALLEALPSGTALLVTADHGVLQVDEPELDVLGPLGSMIEGLSGEGRFRWLHARPGRAADLAAAAGEHFATDAWVHTVGELVDEKWFGPVVTDAARRRLGDVALVARRDVSFADPADGGSFPLVGRHGSMTPAEAIVPLLCGIAD